MKQTKKIVALIMGLTLFTGSLFAGGSQQNSGQSSGKKVLTIASQDPQVPLDMQLNTYSLISRITDSTSETLLYGTADGGIKPLLLTGMPTASADGLTFSFELKKGVTFHNGAPLTSKDVKYSYERLIKKIKMASLLEQVAGYQAFADGKAADLSGFKIIDDLHFSITLSETYTPFVSVLSTAYCAIYPAEACEAAGDEWGLSVLYGTGPFKFVRYVMGEEAVIEKYPAYHGSPAKIDEIVYKFIPSANTQVLEYEKGNVDIVYLDTTLYPTYANGPLKGEIQDYPRVGGWFMSMNVKKIADVRIRQAISLSIDREAICKGIMYGTAKPATGFIPAGLIGYNDKLPVLEYNPTKAKQLLADAGYPNGYDLTVAINTRYTAGVALATAFQAQAKASGINVTINSMDSAGWTDMRSSGALVTGFGNWYVDYNDPDSMLYPVKDSRTDLSSTFWHNAEFKSLMEQGVKTSDTAARQKIYERANEILSREEYPVAMVYNEMSFYLQKPYVSGYSMGADGRFSFADTVINK
ncbi:ABC transporter substrate-binding protein [Treponema primitia]|nr:ABC transporter substrate-binding protein [Treponema primitia]